MICIARRVHLRMYFFYQSYANVAGVCELMLNGEHDTPGEAVAAVVRYLAEDECVPVNYNYLVEGDSETGWEDEAAVAGVRQYSYMFCTQVFCTQSLSA